MKFVEAHPRLENGHQLGRGCRVIAPPLSYTERYNMQQVLSIALIIVAIGATSLPAKAHNAPSVCSVTSRAGGKRVFVQHIRDGEELWLTIDGVTEKRIFRGLTATGSDGAVKVNTANGWTEICSG